MEPTPVISIIIPVRNRAGIVVRTLESIAAQTYKNIRLIIIDNASTDNTAKVLSEWAETHRNEFERITVTSCPAVGAAQARNHGLGLVDTDYVMYFDSDDVMLPDHLQRVNDYLVANPDTEILRWNIGILDGDGWLQAKNHAHPDELRLHIQHTSLSTQRFAVRAEILRKVGGWDEDLSIWLDYELGVRLLASGHSVRVLSGEPRVIVFPTAESITGTSYSSRYDGHRHAFQKIRQHLSDMEDNRLPLLVLAAKEASISAIYRREGARDISRPALRQALTGLKMRQRLGIKIVYLTTRLFGKGGSSVANILFSKRVPKKERD